MAMMKFGDEVIKNYEEKFHKSINDDLNMPIAMSIVWDVIKYPKKSKRISELLKKFDTVLGLNIDNIDNTEEELPKEIEILIEKRKQARLEKDWQKSDELRDEINKLGYMIKDSKDGMKIEKI